MSGIHIHQLAESRVSRGQRMAQTRERRDDLLRLRAREPHYADPAAPRRRRDRHNRLLLHLAHHTRIVARRAAYREMAWAPPEARLV